jgi:hypothetical protein
MSELDRAIDDASKLPLFDAAYALWRMKGQLDRVDPQQEATQPQPVDLKDERALGRVVRAAIANVLHERNTAHEGPTFGRLRRAHPEAKDEDLTRAIKAAVKLDGDCTRFFSYKEPSYLDDVRRAIELAKKENPGFQEQTYESASYHLAVMMR